MSYIIMIVAGGIAGLFIVNFVSGFVTAIKNKDALTPFELKIVYFDDE